MTKEPWQSPPYPIQLLDVLKQRQNLTCSGQTNGFERRAWTKHISKIKLSRKKKSHKLPQAVQGDKNRFMRLVRHWRGAGTDTYKVLRASQKANSCDKRILGSPRWPAVETAGPGGWLSGQLRCHGQRLATKEVPWRTMPETTFYLWWLCRGPAVRAAAEQIHKWPITQIGLKWPPRPAWGQHWWWRVLDSSSVEDLGTGSGCPGLEQRYTGLREWNQYHFSFIADYIQKIPE